MFVYVCQLETAAMQERGLKVLIKILTQYIIYMVRWSYGNVTKNIYIKRHIFKNGFMILFFSFLSFSILFNFSKYICICFHIVFVLVLLWIISDRPSNQVSDRVGAHNSWANLSLYGKWTYEANYELGLLLNYVIIILYFICSLSILFII